MSLAPFDFETSKRIRFGWGRIGELAGLAAPLGQRPFIITGSQPARWREITDTLPAAHSLFAQAHEPSIADLDRAVAAAREADADLIIGLGGGSVIDLAKAVSVMLANPGSAMEYLEVIGEGRPFTRPALPCIAVPTTSGTGAEVTKNAVLFSPEHAVKVSMRHESMLPAIALIDPALSMSCSAATTAQVGMDALVQVIEPFLSHLANPFTDALCRSAIPLAINHLPAAVRDGSDREAREAMAWVSLCGGLALTNAKLGAVHGIAGPLGGMKPIAHGAACARLLPATLRVNAQAIAERQNNAAQQRLDALVTLCGKATLPELIETFEGWLQDFNIPTLNACGLEEPDIALLAEKSQRASSMKGNPVEFRIDEIKSVIHQSMA